MACILRSIKVTSAIVFQLKRGKLTVSIRHFCMCSSYCMGFNAQFVGVGLGVYEKVRDCNWKVGVLQPIDLL